MKTHFVLHQSDAYSVCGKQRGAIQTIVGPCTLEFSLLKDEACKRCIRLVAHLFEHDSIDRNAEIGAFLTMSVTRKDCERFAGIPEAYMSSIAELAACVADLTVDDIDSTRSALDSFFKTGADSPGVRATYYALSMLIAVKRARGGA